jgi:predicted N-acetyltransferase YhbS
MRTFPWAAYLFIVASPVFGSNADCALIDCLRAGGVVLIKRVILDTGEVIGHILFTCLGGEIDGRLVRLWC